MRLGIAIRLLAIVALIAFLGLQGSALKTRAFEGKNGHYTVVLKDGQNASLISSHYDSSGVKVKRVSNDAANPAYVAEMPMDVAKSVEKDDRVAYVALDGTMTVHHNWSDTMKLTLQRWITHV